jgi:hypothetical protein
MRVAMARITEEETQKESTPEYQEGKTLTIFERDSFDSQRLTSNSSSFKLPFLIATRNSVIET